MEKGCTIQSPRYVRHGENVRRWCEQPGHGLDDKVLASDNGNTNQRKNKLTYREKKRFEQDPNYSHAKTKNRQLAFDILEKKALKIVAKMYEQQDAVPGPSTPTMQTMLGTLAVPQYGGGHSEYRAPCWGTKYPLIDNENRNNTPCGTHPFVWLVAPPKPWSKQY